MTEREIHFKQETHYLEKLFQIVISLILAVYLIANAIVWHKQILYKPFILMIGVSCFWMYFLFSLSKRIHSKAIAITTLALSSLSIMFLWNHFYVPLPQSDYEVLWNGAHQILDGTFYRRAADLSDYFCFYSFQIPYVYWISLLLRIHDSLLTIKIAEIICITLTDIVLFEILLCNSSIGESWFGASLFASFPFIVIGSGIINNQHIGLLLGAVALLVVMKAKKTIHYVLAAVVLGVGNLLRPTIFIIFTSILIVLFVQCIKKRKSVLILCIFAIAFFAVNYIADYLFTKLLLAPYGIKGKDYLFKFLLGLTGSGVTRMPTTDAEHTSLYYDLQFFGFDYSAYKAACRAYLFSLFKNKEINVDFIYKKIVRFMTAVDNQFRYGDLTFNEEHVALMECLNFGGISLYISTILFSLINIIKTKKLFADKIFYASIIFCVSFGIHILIEVQTRYRYEQYFCLFVLATPQLSKFLSRANHLYRKKMTMRT